MSFRFLRSSFPGEVSRIDRLYYTRDGAGRCVLGGDGVGQNGNGALVDAVWSLASTEEPRDDTPETSPEVLYDALLVMEYGEPVVVD